MNLVKENNSSMLFTFKGERGLIMAVLPLERPIEQTQILEKYLDKDNWSRLTVKLMRPILDGLLQFNNHLLKFPQDNKEDLLNYFNQFYELSNPEEKKTTESFDFIISHHLVKDQIIVYNFLNLNTHTKNIFKFPAQRKKLINHLNSLSRKFENQQKGKRKSTLDNEVKPMVENFLHLSKVNNSYLYLTRKQIKESERAVLKLIEEFNNSSKDVYHFPTNHI